MRTVTFTGLIAIAEAIDKTWISDPLVAPLAIILVVAILMDTVEFIYNMKK